MSHAKAIHPGFGVKSAVRPQGAVEIAQIKMTHDGQGSDTTPPFVPKESQILPQTSVPSTPWQGSQVQLEFEIPRHLGKLVDAQLNFQLTLSNTGGGTATLMPTTFWCDAIETLYNGNVIERVEREEIHQETAQYLTDQEFKIMARLMNIDPATGGIAASIVIPSGGSTKANFWLPLWANVLNSAQPYIRGFDGTFKLRLWLSNNIWATSDGLPDSGTSYVLNQMYLYATEAGLQPGVESALMSAHNTGCVYRTVIRNKWVKTEQSISAGQEYQQTLTAFNTDSAGLNLYVQPQDSFPYQRLQKLELGAQKDSSSYVQIRDAANGELTIQLQPDYVNTKGALYVPIEQLYLVPFDAASTTNDNLTGLQKFYLFPFCSNMGKVVDEGKVGGGYLLTGQERIVINPATALTGAWDSGATPSPAFGTGGVRVVVVSYEYTKLSCQMRQPSVRRTV